MPAAFGHMHHAAANTQVLRHLALAYRQQFGFFMLLHVVNRLIVNKANVHKYNVHKEMLSLLAEFPLLAQVYPLPAQVCSAEKRWRICANRILLK